MFAALLHWNGQTWEYEPDQFRTANGRVPDFVVNVQNMITMVIEYKPSRPTKTYLETLAETYQTAWRDKCQACPLLCVFFGNLFDGETEYVAYDHNAGEWHDIGNWHESLATWDCEEEAREYALNYRYDLA